MADSSIPPKLRCEKSEIFRGIDKWPNPNASALMYPNATDEYNKYKNVDSAVPWHRQCRRMLRAPSSMGSATNGGRKKIKMFFFYYFLLILLILFFWNITYGHNDRTTKQSLLNNREAFLSESLPPHGPTPKLISLYLLSGRDGQVILHHVNPETLCIVIMSKLQKLSGAH